jgi:hypothetical protein
VSQWCACGSLSSDSLAGHLRVRRGGGLSGGDRRGCFWWGMMVSGSTRGSTRTRRPSGGQGIQNDGEAGSFVVSEGHADAGPGGASRTLAVFDAIRNQHGVIDHGESQPGGLLLVNFVTQHRVYRACPCPRPRPCIWP